MTPSAGRMKNGRAMRSRTYYGLERGVGRSWLCAFKTERACNEWVDAKPDLRDFEHSATIHVDARKAAKKGDVAVWYVDNYWRLI